MDFQEMERELPMCNTVLTVKYMYMSGKLVIQAVLVHGINITEVISDNVKERISYVLGN